MSAGHPTAAEQLVRYLERRGVRHVFGLCGHTNIAVLAAMAALITEAVDPTETGIAMGINTVMRTVGAVIGAQVGAAILTAATIDGTAVPTEGAYVGAFALAAIAAATAAPPLPGTSTVISPSICCTAATDSSVARFSLPSRCSAMTKFIFSRRSGRFR